jgi:hypothetical protein
LEPYQQAAIDKIERILHYTPNELLHATLWRECTEGDLAFYIRRKLGVPGRMKKADRVGFLVKHIQLLDKIRVKDRQG